MTNDTGFVPWLTGLSGAGKSTVAAKLAPALAERGHRVDPHEPPLAPELVLHTGAESVDESVHQVLTWLETNQLPTPAGR